MNVLVAAATRHGATAEIADRIGHELQTHGLSVELKSVADIESLRPLRRSRTRQRDLLRGMAERRAAVRRGAQQRARVSSDVALRQRLDCRQPASRG
jgi:hypothetical protein